MVPQGLLKVAGYRSISISPKGRLNWRDKSNLKNPQKGQQIRNNPGKSNQIKPTRKTENQTRAEGYGTVRKDGRVEWLRIVTWERWAGAG